ncbi:MAG TPA: hypothetical protein VKB68_16100 [Stellaceae bacterium]|nr:hypothetical protein [Stellaceae bacterium]
MTDGILPESDREPAVRSAVIPFEPAAAYVLGYADGRRLVSGQPDDSLQPIRTRFLAHVDAAHPSSAEQAYVAGVRDAAADNFPSPPDEPYRRAA